LHPYILVGPRIVIDSWKAMMVLAFLAGNLVAWIELRQSMGRGRALAFVLLMSWGALFGAHLAHLLLHWGEHQGTHFDALITFWKDGHSFFGALAFCGLLMLVVVKLVPGTDLWKTADAFALGAPLGLFFARLGCYLKGCCWGIPVQENQLFHGFSYKLIENQYTALHPVQLYSAAAALAVFVLLLWVRERRIPGTVLGAFCLLYGTKRFLLEFYRGDTRGGSLLGFLSIHQEISLLLVFGSIIFLAQRWRRNRARA